ncbi:MAG: protein-arginine deiminase domain-containing protein [Sandaracinaceae bacterium]|nr:protein-arginine deiminase domain-containing protein [Sandaracinaceae bacterium]
MSSDLRQRSGRPAREPLGHGAGPRSGHRRVEGALRDRVERAARARRGAAPGRRHDPGHPRCGAAFRGAPRDTWIQDQMLVGYCMAPHAWLHMAVQCKRDRPLQEFVRTEMASRRVGVFDGLAGAGGTSIDFGGNIEVTPPIDAATGELPRDAAGPRVPPQPAAPFGKIIVGDVVDPNTTHGAVTDATRDFLGAQVVQPMLPVDTSWLRVGHVDEVMAVVPDASAGGQAFKVLLASPKAMTALLSRLVDVPYEERSPFHCRKYFGGLYAELDVEDLLRTPIRTSPLLRVLATCADDEAPIPEPTVSVREYNRRLAEEKLAPLRTRLRRGLALGDGDILPVPMYYAVPPVWEQHDIARRVGAHRTRALTVGCVNLQVVDDHLLVPRPYGPRVGRAHAEGIVAGALRELNLERPFVAPVVGSFSHWTLPTSEVPHDRGWQLGAYYARGLSRAVRARVNEVLRRRDATLDVLQASAPRRCPRSERPTMRFGARTRSPRPFERPSDSSSTRRSSATTGCTWRIRPTGSAST